MDPSAAAAAPPQGRPVHRQLGRADSVDGVMFSSAIGASSSFHDVTSSSSSASSKRAPGRSLSSASSAYASSSVLPRAPMSQPIASSSSSLAPSTRASLSASAAAHAALRERSNSWAVGSTPNAHRSHFPGSGHVMDSTASEKLTREIVKAVKVVETFLSPKLLKDQSIPRELLVEAYGLVFLTVYKVGFLFSGKIGNGFIISRTTGGWSAPSFISSGGLGFGMMAGGEVVNYMIILNSRSAVKVFTRNGQFQLGSELDIAVGPIGRAASASVNVGVGGIAPNYSYSHSMGLYGGIGLTSAVICTRKSLNAKCYGANVTARQILGGEVPCQLAVPLWESLDRVLCVERQYANGFPLFLSASTGVSCDSCGHVNSAESHQCAQCRSLLVYSVSVHSGKRSVGELVVTTNHATSNSGDAGPVTSS